MKKLFTIFAIAFVFTELHAQKQIGTINKENLFFVTAINQKPCYAYYEFDDYYGRQNYIYFDDKTFGPYSYLSEKIDCNQNRIAVLCAKNDDKYYVFVNGKEYGPYDLAYTGTFVSDTEYLYYANEHVNPNNDIYSESVFPCINEKIFTELIDLQKSKKGNVVKETVENQKDYYLQYNNKKQGPFSEPIYDLNFLADEKTLVHKAVKNQQEYVYVNDDVQGPYDKVCDIKFSADKKHYAYFAKQDDTFVLVKDGIEQGDYVSLFGFDDDYENPALSFIRDSNELYFIENNQKDKIDDFSLHYGNKIIPEFIPYHFFYFGKDSVLYLKESDLYFNAYIDQKLVKENVFAIIPPFEDTNNYAYIQSKRVTAHEAEKNHYYGSFDSDDENEFNALCLYYGTKEYMLKGELYYAIVLNENAILYFVFENSFYPVLKGYINENEILCYENDIYEQEYSIQINYQDSKVLSGIFNNEQKIVYKGKLYSGIANENQIVYVDENKIFLVTQ